MRFSTCNIPIQLCQWALENKHVRELQVYMWLKMHCSGKIKITPEVLQELTNDLGLKSVKTVKAAIHDLIARSWITKSKRSGYFFIKGFEAIRELAGFDRKTAAEFSIRDIKKIKGFIVAAVISNLISVQKRREWLSERKNGRSMTDGHLPPSFFPVANIVIAKIFNISLSTAWEWKKLAQKHRFIKFRKKFNKVKMEVDGLSVMRKFGEEEFVKKLRYRNGQIYEQMPDMIASNLSLKTRKKISR